MRTQGAQARFWAVVALSASCVAGCVSSAGDVGADDEDAAVLSSVSLALTAQDAVSSDASATTTAVAASSDRLYGVTVDNIAKLPSILAALGRIGAKHRPIARIVFDEGMSPGEYAQAVPAIHAQSAVMGEILDSEYVGTVSVAAYVARAQAYLAAFPTTVDVWEIGNEINGEWLVAPGGTNADVVAKMTGAYSVIKSAGRRTALTLYYNKNCWSSPKNEMFTWVNANVPAQMRTGLDYVLVSYYEDDCNGLQPNWNAVFTQLRQIFPTAKLGIGECGTSKAASKASYINKYYGMSVNVPGYIGGYFWWYFYEDMVPDTKSLFATLLAAMP